MRLARCAMALWACLLAGPASAQEVSAEARKQAGVFFDAGAAAFDAGEYDVAAEAFLSAYELFPSPALHFSAAQAYRRAYLVEPNPKVLRESVRLYRAYLASAPKGKRREDAVAALESLAPVLSRLDLDDEPAPPPAPVTRLLLTSTVQAATLRVDGGREVATPQVVEVAPGPHQVVVRAPGYAERKLEVVAVEGALVPEHVVLEPLDALLSVDAPDGAEVWVDGSLRATLPSAEIALPPGEHFVAVGASGRGGYGTVVHLARAERRQLDIPLPMTGQRVAAWTTLGLGIGGAVATGVLTGLALTHEADAVALRDQREASSLTVVELDDFERAAAARDDFALAAGVSGVLSGAVLLTGVALLAFDAPLIEPVPDAEAEEVTDAPEFTVGLGTLQIRGRF